jgi:hypothetical protein
MVASSLNIIVQWTPKLHLSGTPWPQFLVTSKTKLLLLDATVTVSGMINIPVQHLKLRVAWVMGAADPTSGTVSLHEVVRGLGALTKRGWKPLRTIVIASWDAEEVSAINLVNSFPFTFLCRSMVLLEALSGARISPSGSRPM